MKKKIKLNTKKNKPISQHQLINLALKQNQKRLHAQFPNINFLNDSVILVNKKHKHVLGIYLSDHNKNNIPEKVLVKLPSGKIKNVKTNIVSGLGKAIVTGGISGAVAHEDSPTYTGSGCCVMQDEKANNYLLTNGHVLSDGFLENPLLNTDAKQVLYNDEKIGSWYYGHMNTEGDFALALIENQDFIDNVSPELFNNKIKTISKSDWLKLKIKVRGNKCQVKNAYVIEMVSKRLSVGYKNAQSITFDEVILIADKSNKATCLPVTQAGDSGGLAYTNDNELIGIITAGDNKFSYILPINKLITNLNLTIL